VWRGRFAALRRLDGGFDVVPPELNPSVLLSYLVDVQFTLLAISVAWIARLWRFDWGRARQVALLVAVNLGKPDFLHDPPDIYAILYHSDRHALALDFAVRNARSARRTGRQKCGLPSTGQRLIAV
jgi:hypothetical protein